MLTQLINSSGISICMVGTPACEPFFEQEMHLARRTVGLKYGPMSYDENFIYFCRTLWEYQYVKNKSEITDAIVNWLYEHSSGIVSVVVSLIHDAQEIAILNGTEELNLDVFVQSYFFRGAFTPDGKAREYFDNYNREEFENRRKRK